MTDDFVHLHVSSCYSLRYGVSTPEALVARAAAHGQRALALTDRDGLYGAVKFVRAARAAGLEPIVGVDLALETPSPGVGARPVGPAPARPVRGGGERDHLGPRVVVLARGAGGGVAPGAGWAALCRLVTATHLRGERGRPRATAELIAQHAAAGGGPSPLLVLLGPESDVGAAALAGQHGAARDCLRRWVGLLPPDALAVGVADLGRPPGAAAGTPHARRLLALAEEHGVPAVLTGAVRHAGPDEAVTADVLDAARRRVLLTERHLQGAGSAGRLAAGPELYSAALRVTGERAKARRLMGRSAEIARQCALDPRSDVGVGAVHLPEPEALGLRPDADPQAVLARRAHDALAGRYPGASPARVDQARARLDDELAVVAALGYAAYFLTVARVVDLARGMGVRVAARGSGAGSLLNYALGISGVEPLRHDLLMERFCTPLRAQLPDIDLDVESARRTEVYERILQEFGGERVTCVSMMETYRVRHAVRDVGAALGLPPIEVDTIATAFPHVRARDARAAIADLPELASLRHDGARLRTLFDLVERLDGLPRHVALHPCGVVLSGAGLLGRTPVEASAMGFPMSQFDKDDVEALGLLKLDVLGIRMQSAMAHAVAEVARVGGPRIDLDDEACVPHDDPATFELIRSTRTLGCFQIESPGQRELVGKFAPETFADLIIDISLFRPGPVKSDMIVPFLAARQGWSEPRYLHPSLVGALEETCGVVVFHEQVLRILAVTAGIKLSEADEVRRALGTFEGMERVEGWWRERAAARGYTPADLDRIWQVLAAFASFGFCKAHAAAFALPTYQSAWLKAHHPAAFLAGVLTHDPGMYPKRLILADARSFGVAVLPLDINRSDDTYHVERVGSGFGIRLSLADVKGMSDAELARVVAARPYRDLADFFHRAQVGRPIAERLVVAGAFDELYGIDAGGAPGRREVPTRRDLLLAVADLDRWSRPVGRRGRGRPLPPAGGCPVREAAAAQSQAAAPVPERHEVQLALDLGPPPQARSGLPEMTPRERVQAELEVLGLDISEHVIAPFRGLLDALGVVPAEGLLGVRSRRPVLVAGVKVATQTPPVRSGRRVVFVTVEDSTGPVDATFFDDAQGPFAATIFHSWFLLVRGVTRRTGPRGVSLRATGAWELSELHRLYEREGVGAVRAVLEATPAPEQAAGSQRVLVHPSGFRQSPYADIAPAGTGVPRKLWHASPGSAGR